MQYQVSQSATERLVGSRSARRESSFSGVVMARTSIRSSSPSRPANRCAVASVAYSSSSSSPPAWKMPEMVSSASPSAPATVTVSPTAQPRAAARLAPAIAAAGSSSSAQEPSTSHQSRSRIRPVSTGSPTSIAIA